MARRIIMTLIAAVAVGGFVFVFSAPKQDVIPDRPSAVELVYPDGGNLDLRQVSVVADLAPGYTGYLLVDGVEVPRDDVQFVDALNTLTLRPQPGSDYEALRPGPHCVTAVYHRIGEPESESDNYRWCFRLH